MTSSHTPVFEIERRFLVDLARLPIEVIRGAWGQMAQGYIVADPWLRIRVTETCGYLTLKSKGTVVREEYEMAIPLHMADPLLAAAKDVVRKTRAVTTHCGHGWEVDAYEGRGVSGLITAEVTLQSKDEAFVTPPWAVLEVTEDKRFTAAGIARAQEDPALAATLRALYSAAINASNRKGG